jgi:beta-phosphoglucomutase-like phosphatase (HAD superfamily)
VKYQAILFDLAGTIVDFSPSAYSHNELSGARSAGLHAIQMAFKDENADDGAALNREPWQGPRASNFEELAALLG